MEETFFCSGSQAWESIDFPSGVLLGMALMDTKQYAGAVTAFQDCLKDPGAMQKACESQLGVAKKSASTQLTPPKQ